jgi:hypothetical protein
MFWKSRRRQAQELLDRALSIRDSAPREASYLLAQSVALTPTQKAYIHLGALLEDLGDLSLAAEAFSHGKMAGLSRPNHNTGVALLQIAHIRLKQGHFDIAEKLATDALVFLTSQRPNAIADGHLVRGLARWRQGRESEAQVDFQWVLDNSNSPDLQRYARSFQFSASMSNVARAGIDEFVQTLSVFRDAALS